MLTRAEHQRKLEGVVDEFKRLSLILDIVQNDAVNAPSTLMRVNYREEVKDAMTLIALAQKSVERAREATAGAVIWEST